MRCPACGTSYDDSAFACPKCGRGNSHGAEPEPAVPVTPAAVQPAAAAADTAAPAVQPAGEPTMPAVPTVAAAEQALVADALAGSNEQLARSLRSIDLTDPWRQGSLVAWVSLGVLFFFGIWTFGVGAGVAFLLARKARTIAARPLPDEGSATPPRSGMPMVVAIAYGFSALALAGWALFWVLIILGHGSFHIGSSTATPG
jgi:hypothetical protein